MTRQRLRSRHDVSKPTLVALRCLGWRYSATRDAWVHRLGRGRWGPVFRLPDPSMAPDSTIRHRADTTDLEETAARFRRPATPPPPLPRRRSTPAVDAGPEPVVDLVAAEQAAEADRAADGPRVDGRPPLRAGVGAGLRVAASVAG